MGRKPKRKIVEFMTIGIYYTIINGKRVYDEEGMREEFECKLKEVIEEYDRKC